MAGFHATPADDGLRQMFGEGTHPQLEQLFEGKLAPWMSQGHPPASPPASRRTLRPARGRTTERLADAPARGPQDGRPSQPPPAGANQGRQLLAMLQQGGGSGGNGGSGGGGGLLEPGPGGAGGFPGPPGGGLGLGGMGSMGRMGGAPPGHAPSSSAPQLPGHAYYQGGGMPNLPPPNMPLPGQGQYGLGPPGQQQVPPPHLQAQYLRPPPPVPHHTQHQQQHPPRPGGLLPPHMQPPGAFPGMKAGGGRSMQDTLLPPPNRGLPPARPESAFFPPQPHQPPGPPGFGEPPPPRPQLGGLGSLRPQQSLDGTLSAQSIASAVSGSDAAPKGLWGSDVWAVGGGAGGGLGGGLGGGIWGAGSSAAAADPAPALAVDPWGARPAGNSPQDWQLASMKLRADAGLGQPSVATVNQSLERFSLSTTPPKAQNPIDDLINIMDSPTKLEKLKEEQFESPAAPAARKISLDGKAPPNANQFKSPLQDEGRGRKKGGDGRPRKPSTGRPKLNERELTRQLETLYRELQPTAEELKRKDDCFNLVYSMLRKYKALGDFKLRIFGSGANNFCIRDNNDLDMCIQIGSGVLDKRDLVVEKEFVEKMGEIIQENKMGDILVLPNARVPIVKFTEPKTGVKCDICVNNHLALFNTRLLNVYGAIDERVRQLAFVVKHWAKRRQINEAYRGTLSSYAYVIMCIHLCQTQDPPILPCLQQLEPTINVKCGDWLCRFNDNLDAAKGFGAANTETLGKLLYKFFEYWAFRHSYTDGVISIRTAGWLSKFEKEWTKRVGNERHLICIEDPFQLAHDLGRVVDRNSIAVLRDEFLAAARILQDNGNPLLKLLQPYNGKGNK